MELLVFDDTLNEVSSLSPGARGYYQGRPVVIEKVFKSGRLLVVTADFERAYRCRFFTKR